MTVVSTTDEISGQYCENGHIDHLVSNDVAISAASEGVFGYALDAINADALWKKSEELVGECFSAPTSEA